MPKEIKLEIPNKLAEFIDSLIEEGFYISQEEFARSSIELIAQLYGLPKTKKDGKTLLEILDDKKQQVVKSEEVSILQTTPPKQVSIETDTLAPEEYDILDLFAGVKFEYEDALYAKYTMELMKLAKAPIQKEEFINLLEGLASKKKIEKTGHNGKTVWKLLEGY